MRLGVAEAVVGGEVIFGDLEVEDGRVAAVGQGNGGAGMAVPGFVDLQVNGYGGIDLLTEPERWREVDAMLAELGVTTWQPTLISAPPEQTMKALAAIELGVHLEGPFLSRPGAHPIECLRAPDLELLRRFLAAGNVATVTLAPELPGAFELIDELVQRSVVVSLGHSAADAATADAAFDRGARTVTHLFNVMPAFHHRKPGLVGAALAREDVFVQLICDGVHLEDATVLIAWRAARGRIAVVSDAVAAAGLGTGFSRTPEGRLAGGTGTVPEAVRRLVGLGVPLAEAVDAGTRVPAAILGRTDIGTLEPGARADVVVLDDELQVTRVVRAGIG